MVEGASWCGAALLFLDLQVFSWSSEKLVMQEDTDELMKVCAVWCIIFMFTSVHQSLNYSAWGRSAAQRRAEESQQRGVTALGSLQAFWHVTQHSTSLTRSWKSSSSWGDSVLKVRLSSRNFCRTFLLQLEMSQTSEPQLNQLLINGGKCIALIIKSSSCLWERVDEDKMRVLVSKWV